MSYKMDLEFWDYFEGVKACLITEEIKYLHFTIFLGCFSYLFFKHVFHYYGCLARIFLFLGNTIYLYSHPTKYFSGYTVFTF